MSKSYDIDHEAEHAKAVLPDVVAALQAAEALIAADIVRDDAGILAKVRAAIAKATQP